MHRNDDRPGARCARRWSLYDADAGRPESTRRWVFRWLGAWTLGVGVLTLVPAEGGEPVPFLCLPCGDIGSADAVLNTILFMPLGALLGTVGAGLPTVAALGFGGSTAIELAQTALPGRYPAAGDIVVNGAGAVLGLLLQRRFARGGLPSISTWTLVGAATLAATAAGSLRSPPRGLLYGQHTPQLGSLDVYDGTVLDARLGGRSIGVGPLDDSDDVRDGLRRPDDVTVVFEVGTPPPGWAPLFAIFSADQEEALFLGVRGEDVVMRVRSLAGALRFVEPSMVFQDALAGLQPGDTAVLSSRVDRSGLCLETAVRGRCRLGVRPTEGWRFLRRDVAVPLPRTWVSTIAVAGFAALLFLSGTRTRAASALAGLGGIALLLPLFTPLAPARISGLALALVAGAGGAHLVDRIPARGADPRSSRTGSPPDRDAP